MKRIFNKNISIAIIAVSALVLVAVGVIIFFIVQKPDISKNNPEFEMGEKAFISDLLQDGQKDKLVTRDKLLDLSKPGESKVTFSVKNQIGISYEITVSYFAKDTTAPEINLKSDKIIIPFSESEEFDPMSQIASVSDNSGIEPKVVCSGNIIQGLPGTYSVEFVATDGSGNETKKKIEVTVENCPYLVDEKGNFALVDGTYTTKNGKTLTIENGIASIDGTIIVNKSFSLPANYNPGLNAEANASFVRMKAAAKKDKIDLFPDNAYRSYETQNTLYRTYLRKQTQAEVDMFSARPGFSEHQTGLAFDIVFSSTEEIPSHIEEIEWLNQNAYKYGFILRYPEVKYEITGYKYEPWHYRYVGNALAKVLYNNGTWMTLEEYFGIDSAYKF